MCPFNSFLSHCSFSTCFRVFRLARQEVQGEQAALCQTGQADALGYGPPLAELTAAAVSSTLFITPLSPALLNPIMLPLPPLRAPLLN
jgi:hypothetical protein